MKRHWFTISLGILALFAIGLALYGDQHPGVKIPLPIAIPFLLSFPVVFGIEMYTTHRDFSRHQQQRLEHFELRAEQEPEKVRFAWDLARVKLESYFDRNLAQVKAIFAVAIVVMAAGFCFIMWGLRAALANPDRVKVALIASASGVITQFIGLTFMVIYRSTMLQATQFMSVLDRINNVGMAVQILDSIKEGAGDLKDSTRVEIIRLLLTQPSARIFTPGKTKTPMAYEKPDK